MTGDAGAASGPRSLARGRALRPGDRVAVLSVSGPVDAGPKLGWASLFAPMPSVPGSNPHYSFGSLLRVLTRPAAARELRYPDAVTVTSGVARGVTMGGTLTLLASSAC